MVDAHLEGVRVKLLGLPQKLDYKDRVTRFGVEYDFDATRRILQDQKRSLAELRESVLDSLHSSLLILLTFTVDANKTIADPTQTSFLGGLSEKDLIVQNTDKKLCDKLSSDPVVLKIKLCRIDDEITCKKESIDQGDNEATVNMETLNKQRDQLMKQLKYFELKRGSTSIFGPGAFRVGSVVKEARRFFNNRVNINGTSISIPIDRDLSYDRLRNHRTPVSHIQLASLYLPPSGRGTPAEGWLLSNELGNGDNKDHHYIDITSGSTGSADPLDTIARMLLIPPDRVSISKNRSRGSANVRAYRRTWDEGASLSEKRHPPTSEAKSMTNADDDTIAISVGPGIIFIVPYCWKLAEVLTRTLLNTDPESVCAIGSRQTGQVILYPTKAKSVGVDRWSVPSVRLLKQMLLLISTRPNNVENYQIPASVITRQMNKEAVSNLLMILRRVTLGDSKITSLTDYAPNNNRAYDWPSSSSSTSGAVSGSSEMRAIVIPSTKATKKVNKEDVHSEYDFFQKAGSGVTVIASDMREAYLQEGKGLPEHSNHHAVWVALERGAGHIVPVSLKWVLGAIPTEIRDILSLSIIDLGESGVIVTPPTFLTALTSATWR